MRSKKGFTLIEVIVVIAIIGILAALTTPNVSSYYNRNKERQRIEHKNVIDKAVRQCYALEGKLPPSTTYLANNNYVVLDDKKYTYVYTPKNEDHTYNLEVKCK